MKITQVLCFILLLLLSSRLQTQAAAKDKQTGAVFVDSKGNIWVRMDTVIKLTKLQADQELRFEARGEKGAYQSFIRPSGKIKKDKNLHLAYYCAAGMKGKEFRIGRVNHKDINKIVDWGAYVNDILELKPYDLMPGKENFTEGDDDDNYLQYETEEQYQARMKREQETATVGNDGVDVEAITKEVTKRVMDQVNPVLNEIKADNKQTRAEVSEIKEEISNVRSDINSGFKTIYQQMEQLRKNDSIALTKKNTSTATNNKKKKAKRPGTVNLWPGQKVILHSKSESTKLKVNSDGTDIEEDKEKK